MNHTKKPIVVDGPLCTLHIEALGYQFSMRAAHLERYSGNINALERICESCTPHEEQKGIKFLELIMRASSGLGSSLDDICEVAFAFFNQVKPEMLAFPSEAQLRLVFDHYAKECGSKRVYLLQGPQNPRAMVTYRNFTCDRHDEYFSVHYHSDAELWNQSIHGEFTFMLPLAVN